MKSNLAVFFLVLSSVINAQKQKPFYVHWHETGTVDINTRPDGMLYSEKGRLYYLSNDKDNLYIDVRIFDKNVQREILSSGMTVWINMDGKKNKKTGLRYPARGQNQRAPTGEGRPGNPANTNRQVPADSKIEVIGFTKKPVYIAPSEPNNFNGSINYDKGGYLLYKLSIPISKISTSSHNSKKGENILRVGFSYPALAMNNGTRMPSGGGGGFGGSGGMGGGMRGGSGGGMGGGRGMARGSGTGGGQGGFDSNTVLFWLDKVPFATRK